MFSSLGTWQVFRAMEKEELQKKMDFKYEEKTFILKRGINNIESKNYIQVEAIGHYDKINEILIDNAIHKGRAGYHVLTPFILKEDQSVIMVNRGWIPVNRDRSVLPELKTPDGRLHISGIIAPPKSKPPLILGEPDISSKLWLYFDEKVFEKKIGQPILPMIILLGENDEHGYIRKWPKYEGKASMHIGYAIQWYAFALIVLVTYLGVNFKKIKQSF
ncbi:MAG: SURF1 family protein [Gammaproteobacteria bacterium]|nr:SURF1 family protein [Gammaproteobacteria bacterium]